MDGSHDAGQDHGLYGLDIDGPIRKDLLPGAFQGIVAYGPHSARMYTDYFFIVGPNPHHQCKIGLSQRFVKRLLGLLWCCEHKNRNPGERAGRQRERRGLLVRSEEHTSELQSLMRISYAVFCLKKNKNIKNRYK